MPGEFYEVQEAIFFDGGIKQAKLLMIGDHKNPLNSSETILPETIIGPIERVYSRRALKAKIISFILSCEGVDGSVSTTDKKLQKWIKKLMPSSKVEKL